MTDTKRVSALASADLLASDDFLLIDSPTSGTRKYQASKLIAAAAAAQAAVLDDWSQAAAYIHAGLGPVYFPVASKANVPWSTYATSSSAKAEYTLDFDSMHHSEEALASGETLPVVHFQLHHCLPFDTQFSPYQAFIKAVTAIPAGTYNVKMGFSWGTNVVADKYYQFTLTQELPIGGVLTGFYGAPDNAPSSWKVYAYASNAAATATETCAVTEGSGGTNLGTFTAAGVTVPASGTPDVTVVGSLQFYGLNSLHRVAYGDNRWLHSPLRQYLNKAGYDWWAPATVFDRPPAYSARQGFLSGFSDDFLAHVQKIERKTALNYVTDGGTSGAPEYDTTYDWFTLPSGREHFLADNSTFGGGQGREGAQWDYWKRASGSSSPLAWYGTYTQYIQYDLASPTTPRHVWMRSAHRGYGHYVARVASSGGCHDGDAIHGFRCAPACAIG